MNVLRPVVTLFLLAIATTCVAQNPGDQTFAGTQVHTINLRFPQAHYWDSLTIYYNEGKERCLPATLVINGEVLDSVGVRLKGNSSYSHPNDKKSMRIVFDEFRPDQRYDGLKGIHLNNCYSDPTFMREKIHLDFCRDAGIPAPRANYAQVKFNDVDYAFYSLVEHVDKGFLSTRFGANNGYLFKAVDAFGGGGGGAQVLSDFRVYTGGTSAYIQRYERKTGDSVLAWDALTAFITTLNASGPIDELLPSVLDMTTLYRATATDLLFGSLDSYVGSGRNFYAYIDSSTGKLKWIVWDTNMSFGGFPQGGPTIETLGITYVSSTTGRPLVGKIFASPTLKAEYLQSVCELAHRFFTAERLFPKIDAIAAIIRPYVAADMRKMYSLSIFDQNINTDYAPSGGPGTRNRKPGLKSFITAREGSVAEQLAALGVTCFDVAAGGVVINEIMTDNDTIPDAAGDFDDWVELHNASDQEVDLGGMYLSDNYGVPTKWQFPAGTTIAPRGYLIVWADEDGGQEGLHASFKLTADGEQLMLSTSDLTVIDSVSWGEQAVNRSLARIPNGSGPFAERSGTFAMSNDAPSGVTGDDASIAMSVRNHPNPFGRATTFEVRLPRREAVSLRVFNALGAEVATLFDEVRDAGTYQVLWNAASLPSGTYFYTLRSGSSARTGSMIIERGR
jgi:spore coat protein H